MLSVHVTKNPVKQATLTNRVLCHFYTHLVHRHRLFYSILILERLNIQ